MHEGAGLHRHGVRRRPVAQGDPQGPPGRRRRACTGPCPWTRRSRSSSRSCPRSRYLHDHEPAVLRLQAGQRHRSRATRVKLIDLGGVRRIDDLQSAIFGTVGYQAPEVAEVGPSVASDIYTIGRTLATLVLDFRGNTTTYVASLPAGRRHPRVPEVRLVLPAARQGVRARTRRPVRHGRRAPRPAPGRAARGGRHRPRPRQPRATTRRRRSCSRRRRSTGRGHPLAWDELPALKVDADRPDGELAGRRERQPTPSQRIAALADAPRGHRRGAAAPWRAPRSRPGDSDACCAPRSRRSSSDDPWEWRAAWLEGLGAARDRRPGRGPRVVQRRLRAGARRARRRSSRSPRRASVSGEPDIAESLYVICARSDANYTAPPRSAWPASGRARGDLDGALDALDLVGPTRGSFPDARLQRARLLVVGAPQPARPVRRRRRARRRPRPRPAQGGGHRRRARRRARPGHERRPRPEPAGGRGRGRRARAARRASSSPCATSPTSPTTARSASRSSTGQTPYGGGPCDERSAGPEPARQNR